MSKKQDIFQDEERLKKESPLLHSIAKENPFSVPENYFESLPSEIIEKCRTEAEPKKWGNGILTTVVGYKWSILSVTGCLILVCFFILRNNSSPQSYEAIIQTIPDSLIVEQLDKNINSISITNLEEVTETQDQESSSANVKSTSDSTNSDQQIIAYLIDNNVSVSEIENE